MYFWRFQGKFNISKKLIIWVESVISSLSNQTLTGIFSYFFVFLTFSRQLYNSIPSFYCYFKELGHECGVILKWFLWKSSKVEGYFVIFKSNLHTSISSYFVVFLTFSRQIFDILLTPQFIDFSKNIVMRVLWFWQK